MFKKDQSGNVALLFALLLPVLMVGTGGAVEVSRAVEYKQRLVSATDLACRQAEVYVESLGLLMPQGYAATVQSYATKNRDERQLTSSAQITATPTISSLLLVPPLLNLPPGNIHVAATGSVDLIFKNFLSKNSISFTVSRDCTVNAPPGQPELLLSESFEGYIPQLNGDWGVFGTLTKPTCESASCQGKSWTTTGAGVEVDKLSAIPTGAGVQYGQVFAELDSDCSNRIGTASASQKAACAKGTANTNSSISMALQLDPGTYEVGYVYTARKGLLYQYLNDDVICSKPSDTDGLQRDADVAKTAAGGSTIKLDGQTRRIELWVEPKGSGYLSDNQNLTAATNPSYMKSYMADVCVWAKLWVPRSYKFTVTATNEYRITWRAAGLADTLGGLIDYLRICKNACP